MPPEEQFRLLFGRRFAQSLAKVNFIATVAMTQVNVDHVRSPDSKVADMSLVARVMSLLNIAPAMKAVLVSVDIGSELHLITFRLLVTRS